MRFGAVPWVLALSLCVAATADAHPAPFSYLDLNIDSAGVSGTLVVHDLDAAHDLGVTNPDTLLEPAVAARYRDQLVTLLSPRLSLTFGGRPVQITWGAIDVVPDRQSLRLAFTVSPLRPGHIGIHAYLFPYDLIHQTFINIYEDTALTRQLILDATHQDAEYYSGSTQGRWAVVKTFVISGIEHILIGPDHLLFLVGLLLLGGSIRQLLLVVTAFTAAHSITLSLAATGVVIPPASIVEPAIALSVVYVGADNLLVGTGRDTRAWIAFAFGLIHGFGFANVLREMNLPNRALGWTLFGFNIGVEIGQLAVVAVVASALAWVRSRSRVAGARLAVVGSIVVMLAGAYWFLERVFFPGATA